MKKICEACGAGFTARGVRGALARTCSMKCRSAIPHRFWPKVDKETGPIHPTLGRCWIWTANLNNDGYGCFRVGGKYLKAHRVSWGLANGEAPADREVCHSCDNPACVRADHLFLGTHMDNVRDCVAKGRHVAPRGDDNHNSKLTADKVARIKQLLRDGHRQVDVARDFGMSSAAINFIAAGRTWRHVA